VSGFSTGRTGVRGWLGERAPLALLIWLAAVATVVILPTFFWGDISGHDFEFHVASWIEVARQWHQGVWYPRWAEMANFGFGEPRFIFYPPLSWLIGAALGTILPWHAAPDAYIWLTLMLAGVSMFQLSRRWLTRRNAMAAAVLFAVNPYHLVIVFYRSDFAELLASALLPVLILCALELQKASWRGVCKFAVAFALIWLTNAPAAVIGTYSSAVIVLAAFAADRDWRILMRAGCGAALGFAVGAFYILPAALERSWVQIGTVLTNNLQPWHNFLFTHSDDPEFLLFNWKVSAAALLTIGVFAVSAVFVTRARKNLPGRFWPLATLGIVSIALMFPFTSLVWSYLPELKFVQFPWRWLLPLEVLMTLFFCYAAAGMRRPWMAWVLSGALLAGLGAWMTTNTWWDKDDVPTVLEAITDNHGYEGADEYVPTAADHDELDENAPSVEMQDNDKGESVPFVDGEKVSVGVWKAEYRVIEANLDEPLSLLVKLFPYPAWRASLNGSPVSIGHGDQNGQTLIQLPAGKSEVVLRFERTKDRLAGGIVSLLGLAALIALWMAGQPSSFMRR